MGCQIIKRRGRKSWRRRGPCWAFRSRCHGGPPLPGTWALDTSGTISAMPELIAPSAAKSAEMSRVRNRHTAPELAIRRELHRRGLRYRVNLPLAGFGGARPDIVFTRIRVAVFVDGCFWHCCPDHKTFPKTNADWWREKLATNVKRDRTIDKALADAGWEVIRIWEHEDATAAVDRLQTVVRTRYTKPTTTPPP